MLRQLEGMRGDLEDARGQGQREGHHGGNAGSDDQARAGAALRGNDREEDGERDRDRGADGRDDARGGSQAFGASDAGGDGVELDGATGSHDREVEVQSEGGGEPKIDRRDRREDEGEDREWTREIEAAHPGVKGVKLWETTPAVITVGAVAPRERKPHALAWKTP